MTETDAVIVGAGPAGLFQVFQLGLQEIRSHVIDALPHPGGQCVELYADKPIYDIPGIAVCTGQELSTRLMEQAAPFQPQYHWNQLVSQVERQPDQRLRVETSAGQQFLCKTLFIAAGVGAFVPKSVKAPGMEDLHAGQIQYSVNWNRPWQGRRVWIIGDTEAALQSAIGLAHLPLEQRPASICLMHRREVFAATETTVSTLRQLQERGLVQFVVGQLSQVESSDGHLTGMQVLDAQGQLQRMPLDDLIIQLGLSPKLGPIADWGLAMERKQLAVEPASCQTSVPGIFAVGDINTYPGKRKLIVCAFHECVMAAFAAVPLVFAGRQPMLQYTTSSPHLQELLGLGKRS